MNYLDIANKVFKNHNTLIIGLLKYVYSCHSTGRHLTISLVGLEAEIPVYYETKWISSHYDFNEDGKKSGFLFDDKPWNESIKAQFETWEKEIVEKEEKEKRTAALRMASYEAEQKRLLQSYAAKFINEKHQ